MADVVSTIAGLKRFNRLQNDLIGDLEAYERIVAGQDAPEGALCGYCNGYAAELGYLKERRTKLDLAISSVERYGDGANLLGGIS